MHYAEHEPGASLRRSIECVWTLDLDASDACAEPQRIVPDGCVEWIVHLGAPVREHLPDGTKRLQPQRFVIGPRDRATLIEPTGALRCLGIRFHPAGAHPFLRAAQGELYDRVVRPDVLAPTLDRMLASRLDPEDPPERWAVIAEAALCELGVADPDPLAEMAANAILAAHGRVPIEVLAARLGVTRRTLERRFDQHVGLSPKRLARVARFQRVFHWTREREFDWASVALACGFTDQAHLIRDFRELAGETPAALVAEEPVLTELFTRRNRASHSSNRLA